VTSGFHHGSLDRERAELLDISAALGADCRQVQGPVGNISLKRGITMLVTAHGAELGRALTENIFTEVSVSLIRAALAHGVDRPLDGVSAPGGLPPSIETGLHALMPQRVVIHTHAVPVVAAACRAAAPEFLKARLGLLAWVLVDYARPGTPLARLAAEALERYPATSVMILRNHGVVVGADTVKEAYQLLLDVTARLDGPPRLPQSSGDQAALARLAAVHGMTRPGSPPVHELALNPVSLAVATRGTLYPDHAATLGSGVGLWSERERARSDPLRPRLWLVPGVGALLEPGLPLAAHAMARCLGEVVALLPDADACRFLSPAEEAEVVAEVHR
jgi:rhamnose utilization protein RhaD (predicted bifunctional aldolase and dehydrogenase)